jgi:hypothetical protein
MTHRKKRAAWLQPPALEETTNQSNFRPSTSERQGVPAGLKALSLRHNDSRATLDGRSGRGGGQ